MSNFFPNKTPDLVLVDMINAHFQTTAERSNFSFGQPIVNDNPFANTVMDVTVTSGPLVGRLSQVFYNRLNFSTLLTDRLVTIPDGNYTNLSDILPTIAQETGIVITNTDIFPSTLADSITDQSGQFKIVRLVASAASIAYTGAGDVRIELTPVAGFWTVSGSLDTDIAATAFPFWENNYPMTGYVISPVEQNVPVNRSFKMGVGISYLDSYQIIDIDNQVDLVVATAENWAIDAFFMSGDSLPIHGQPGDFEFRPYIKIRLVNPQPGYETLQPLKFLFQTNPNQGGRRMWSVVDNSTTQYFTPAYENETDPTVYVARTRLVDESYQAPTSFSSTLTYFNDAIGNDGQTFNPAIFEISMGMESISDGSQMFGEHSTYLSVTHFLYNNGSGEGDWVLSYESTARVNSFESSLAGPDTFLMMKPGGVDVSPNNFQALIFLNSTLDADAAVYFRSTLAPATVVPQFDSLLNANNEYAVTIDSVDDNLVIDLIVSSSILLNVSNYFRMEVAITDPAGTVLASKFVNTVYMDNGGGDWGMSLIDDTFSWSAEPDHIAQMADESLGYRSFQIRLTKTQLDWLLTYDTSNLASYRYSIKPYFVYGANGLSMALNPTVAAQLNNDLAVLVTDNL